MGTASPDKHVCIGSAGGDNSGQGPDESGEDNSPVASDDEEEDEEDDIGSDSAKKQDVHSDKDAAVGVFLSLQSSDCDDNKSRQESSNTQNPIQLLENQRNSPKSANLPTASETLRQSPFSTCQSIGKVLSLDPLVIPSRMTVAASVEETHTKDSVIREEEGFPSSLTSSKTVSKCSVSKIQSENQKSSSPANMTSVLVPVSSKTPSPSLDKDRAKRLSPKNISQQRKVHSSFYEKMAAQALAAAALSSTVVTESASDQPLDLSKKSSRQRSGSEPEPPSRRTANAGGKRGVGGTMVDVAGSNGISSLQSLQKRFGGDFLMETARRPNSIIPLQPTLLPSKSILRSPLLPGNGLSHLTISAAAAAAAAAVSGVHHLPHQLHHSIGTKAKANAGKGERLDKCFPSATATSATSSASSKCKTDKGADSEQSQRPEDTTKPAKAAATVNGSSSSSSKASGEDLDNKYIIHRCSCQKSFGTLYTLSAHLQESGHMPGSSKQTSLMDYPKLVRGQDMWLNQESEQTRRILRCMQCGESFKSLPMLTVHMMQTQHYSKIVSTEHGRRAHKCSAYCDRELDKECIFKCKVCQETFSDMEGLANHMIVSGHHKKQVLRSSHYSDMTLRHKHRKRFLSDETSGGSTVASLLEYKRKYQGEGGAGSNGCLSQVGRPSPTSSLSTSALAASADGLITCESCGKKIEMQWFVEHVRACLHQKAEVIDALKVKLAGEEIGCKLAIQSKSAASISPQLKKGDAQATSTEQPLPPTAPCSLFKRLTAQNDQEIKVDKEPVAEQNKSERQKNAASECQKNEVSNEANVTQADNKQNEECDRDSKAGDCARCDGESESNGNLGVKREREADINNEVQQQTCNNENNVETVARIQSKGEMTARSTGSVDNCKDSEESLKNQDRADIDNKSLSVPDKLSHCTNDDDNNSDVMNLSKNLNLSEKRATSPRLLESSADRKTLEGTIDERAGTKPDLPVDLKADLPPRIPSPMTDEDNTSERSPSSASTVSQSGDSKPPTPTLSPLSLPLTSLPSAKLVYQKASHSGLKSIKRCIESHSDSAQKATDIKKAKLDELIKQKISCHQKIMRQKHAHDDDEFQVTRKKIKVELPDEYDFNEKSPHCSSSSTSSPAHIENSWEHYKKVNVKNGEKCDRLTESCSTVSGKLTPEQSLDIIDPNCNEELAREGASSALKAMESFIQRSFSSKFDSRRNMFAGGFGALSGLGHMNPLMGMARGLPSSPSPSSLASSKASLAYMSRFSKFFSPMPQPSSASSSKYLDIAAESAMPSFEKNVLSSLSAKSAELLEKSRSSGRDVPSRLASSDIIVGDKTNRSTLTKNRDVDTKKDIENDDEREEEIESRESDEEREIEKEDLTSKYLNPDEEERQGEAHGERKDGEDSKEKSDCSRAGNPGSGKQSSSGKQSALDSLSSFVYGQPMTSEHPLDSLQKLLTKTSIPKILSSTPMGSLAHFTPHHYSLLAEQMMEMERVCFTPPLDMPTTSTASASVLPLNLSMKSGDDGGGSEDEDVCDNPDHDSPSTSRDFDESSHGESPGGLLGPDGELTEYKCAACSRRFASKGSYRYHLSRCHLSSVKKYGIKEAFNMSPYVYLPLDHTAKFTKYYQMAQELASKGK